MEILEYFSANTGAWIILSITVLVSLFALSNTAVLEKCVMRPYRVWRRQQMDTLYLSGFMHADFGHLLVNMFTFYFFAFPLERVMGTTVFVVGYLLAIVISSLPSVYLHRNDASYATLGASGGVSAILFAHVLFYPTNSIFIMPIPVPIPAWLYAVGFLAYSFYAGRSGGGRINHDAHFAGAVFGVLWALIVAPETVTRWLSMLG